MPSTRCSSARTIRTGTSTTRGGRSRIFPPRSVSGSSSTTPLRPSATGSTRGGLAKQAETADKHVVCSVEELPPGSLPFCEADLGSRSAHEFAPASADIGQRNSNEKSRPVEERREPERSAELLEADDPDREEEDADDRAPDVELSAADRGRSEER